MNRQLILLLLVLGFCVSPMVQGATIVWVGENDDQNGDGVVDDIFWPGWLEGQGYTVDVQRNYWANMNEDKVAELNAADLVIVSRNTDSGDYNQGQEPALWNSVTTPMILMTPYLSRSNRWGWVSHDGLMHVGGEPAWLATDSAHPIFFGVELDASNQVAALDAAIPSDGTALLDGDAGNGHVIATSEAGTIAIVEWEPAETFYAGGATVAARRLLFCAGSSEPGGNAQGAFNLTPDGAVMFLNAVKYMLGLDLQSASSPSPADSAEDVRPDSVLSWQAGPMIASHDVYFGSDMAAVSAATRSDAQGVLVSQGQIDSVYTPISSLTPDQTYYWRIDEIEADGTIHAGPVWNFTAEPVAYVVAGVEAGASIPSDADAQIESLVDGSGLTPDGGHSVEPETMWQGDATGSDEVAIEFTFDKVYKLDEMLVWNFNNQFENVLKFSCKDIAVAYATEPNEWIALGDYTLPQGTGTPANPAEAIDFNGTAAQYVRITVNSSYGDSSIGLSEVRFMYVPTFAREPEPEDGAENVASDVTLSWRPGREAVTHEVHLGTDLDVVAAGEALVGSVDSPNYDTSGLNLALGQTFYWMIGEVNEAGTPRSWNSDVWGFSTPPFIVVDDMESYDDEENRIYFSWIDGIDDNTNGGSQVAPQNPPYTEQDNVHGGDQAMIFDYGLGGQSYSEVDMALAGADWTLGGATTLALYFSGNPGNAPGQLYVEINGTRVNYSGDSSALTQPLWTQWNIDLTSLSVNLSNVTVLTLGVSGAGTGTLNFDDIRLYSEAPAAASEVIWIEAETTSSITVPLEVRSDDPDASGGQYLTVMQGNNSMDAPPAEGVATYTFTVQGGTYKLMARILVPTADDNSLWLRIPDATTQTANHSSGWVWWYDAAVGGNWHWDNVRSNNDDGEVVEFTLPAGTHTLEIGYREDGLQIDAFVLTNGLD